MSGIAFEIGSVVKLNSGGPEMAVKAIYNDQYTCQWFAGKKLEQGVFRPETLVLVRQAGE